MSIPASRNHRSRGAVLGFSVWHPARDLSLWRPIGGGTSARGTSLTSNEIFNGGIADDLQAAEFGREGAVALGGA